MNPRVIATLAVVAGVLGACTPDADTEAAGSVPPPMHFDTARVRLVTATDTVRLVVELARTAEQKTMGLMERTQLADSAGMLFLYDTPQPPTAAFWMFRTRIPLDIAFIDSAGVIRSIHSMVPCPATIASSCPNYPAGAEHSAALEVNSGWFGRHGAKVGDRVVLRDVPQ